MKIPSHDGLEVLAWICHPRNPETEQVTIVGTSILAALGVGEVQVEGYPGYELQMSFANGASLA